MPHRVHNRTCLLPFINSSDPKTGTITRLWLKKCTIYISVPKTPKDMIIRCSTIIRLLMVRCRTIKTDNIIIARTNTRHRALGSVHYALLTKHVRTIWNFEPIKSIWLIHKLHRIWQEGVGYVRENWAWRMAQIHWKCTKTCVTRTNPKKMKCDERFWGVDFGRKNRVTRDVIYERAIMHFTLSLRRYVKEMHHTTQSRCVDNLCTTHSLEQIFAVQLVAYYGPSTNANLFLILNKVAKAP